jgi:hypothetical protein
MKQTNYRGMKEKQRKGYDDDDDDHHHHQVDGVRLYL